MRAIGFFILNVAQALWLAFSSLLWMSLAILVSIFSPNLPLVMARRFWGPWLIWGAGARIDSSGSVPLDGPGPYVFIMNHQSMLDIPVAFAHIPINLRFIAKKVLKMVPLLGWYMWRTGMIFVERGGKREALSSIKRAGAKVRAGASILAYPEGTRSTDGSILPFKKGVFIVAVQAGVPIVPVVIDRSGDVLPRGGFAIRPGLVRLRIGAPIPTAGLKHRDVETVMRRVRDAMIDLHLSIGGAGGDKDDCVAPSSTENPRSGRRMSEAAAS